MKSQRLIPNTSHHTEHKTGNESLASAPGHTSEHKVGQMRGRVEETSLETPELKPDILRKVPSPGQQDIHTCENGHTIISPFSNTQNSRMSELKGDLGINQMYTFFTTKGKMSL